MQDKGFHLETIEALFDGEIRKIAMDDRFHGNNRRLFFTILPNECDVLRSQHEIPRRSPAEPHVCETLPPAVRRKTQLISHFDDSDPLVERSLDQNVSF